jgi:hypothetical protein
LRAVSIRRVVGSSTVGAIWRGYGDIGPRLGGHAVVAWAQGSLENSKLLVSWLEKIRPRIRRHGAFVCTGLSPRVVSLIEDLDHDGLSRAVEVVDARDLEHRPACITQPCSVHDEVVAEATCART